MYKLLDLTCPWQKNITQICDLDLTGKLPDSKGFVTIFRIIIANCSIIILLLEVYVLCLIFFIVRIDQKCFTLGGHKFAPQRIQVTILGSFLSAFCTYLKKI